MENENCQIKLIQKYKIETIIKTNKVNFKCFIYTL